MDMYVVAEEDNDDAAGSIVILSANWLTPKKKEAFWPPYKTQASFNKSLKQHQNPGDDWAVIKIKKTFFECDDLLVARRKAQEAEGTSDLTDGEQTKRKRYATRPLYSSSDDESNIFYKHAKVTTATKPIFENTGNRVIEGHSPATSPPLSPARFPTEKSGNRVTERHSPATSLPLSPTRFPTEKSGTLELNGTHHGCENWANSNITASTPSIAARHTTSTLRATKTAYDYNVMQLLTTIKEQNTVILDFIRKQNAKEFQMTRRDLKLPIEFPINDYEQLLQLESFLTDNQNFTDLCEYFGEFVGPTVTGTVNSILKHTMTNRLAATFSFRGKKGKRAFEDLTLKTAIVRAVKKICNVVRDQPIEDDMKVWLKHAPQRIILQEKKIRARLDRSVNV